MPKRNKKLALKLGIQTCQILTKDDEVCFPSLSSILLAVLEMKFVAYWTIKAYSGLFKSCFQKNR